MKGKAKSLKVLIASLIAALLIFIPVMAVPQSARAATNQYHMTEARDLAVKVNQFRAKTNWVYNSRNQKVTTSKKSTLIYDYKLESEYAKIRAKEASEVYAKTGKLSHTRPNGKTTPNYNGKVKGTINGKTQTYTVKNSKVVL